MSQTCLTLAYITRPMHVLDMSYTSSRLSADAMSQTWSYTGSHNNSADAFDWVRNSLDLLDEGHTEESEELGEGVMPMPCPRHGLTVTIKIEADAMSQTWSYAGSHISVPMSYPRHSLTLTHLYVPMPCPRHGLTLTHLVADACPRHVLYWLTL
ncbi:hypothetical protein F383_02829 [Gossypium arboreum]|uniref:Uncharacterized protein n=1 Tax=Gossypium arboreum TaxID=29729 RepID=A0A0B0NZH2_GOSAR|nr:hypothetical protein F383_02829 [Gossypium arboreum]